MKSLTMLLKSINYRRIFIASLPILTAIAFVAFKAGSADDCAISWPSTWQWDCD